MAKEECMAREQLLEQRIAHWKSENPQKKPIRLDGDVSGQPMRGAPLAAMQAAVAQLGCKGTFPGTSPACGHAFLREAFALSRTARGIETQEDEVFAVTGRHTAYMRLFAAFAAGTRVLVVQPGDETASMAARAAGHTVVPLAATEENGFLPAPERAGSADVHFPDAATLDEANALRCAASVKENAVNTGEDCATSDRAEVVCLGGGCVASGQAYGTDALARWAEYAAARGALLVLDTTYEPFRAVALAHGAWGGVAEVRGLSVVEGFCGADCALLAVPHSLAELHQALCARAAVEGCGVAFPVQRAAAALLGAQSGREPVAGWRENAAIVEGALNAAGVRFWGGRDAPFFWLRCPQAYAQSSRAFCEELLTRAGVACVEGALFGAGGEGFLRISALGDRGAIEIGMKRLLPFLTDTAK